MVTWVRSTGDHEYVCASRIELLPIVRNIYTCVVNCYCLVYFKVSY